MTLRRTKPMLGASLSLCLGLGMILLFSGCANENNAPLPVSADNTLPEQTSAVVGLLAVGEERDIYIECRGTGHPTVVLIGGLRAAGDYLDRAEQTSPSVMQEVSTFTRVCTYDRPGTVRSSNEFSRSEAVEQPTTQPPAVEDLHAVLASAREVGPFVFAAHSYGGFIARGYAAAYPDELAGMVLIDALSEGYADALSTIEFAQWKNSTAVADEDIEAYPGIERLEFDEVMQEAREYPVLAKMPLSVLSADKLYEPIWNELIESGALPQNTLVELGGVIDRAQHDSQRFLAGLTQDAVHITRTSSGHDIPLEHPRLVVDAIRGVWDQASNARS